VKIPPHLVACENIRAKSTAPRDYNGTGADDIEMNESTTRRRVDAIQRTTDGALDA
jgi:hypothetical protein